jgi:tetratricopeptide (TPR) repeat protein
MVTDGLMESWYTVSPAAILPAASGHMVGLRGLLPGSRELASAAGRAALLTGHCLIKLDRRSDAYRVYSLAEMAARDAGDGAVRGLVLCQQSSLYSTVAEGLPPGDIVAALRLLDEAVAAVPRGAPGRLRATIHDRRAEERAVMGDATGALRDLEAAELALAEQGEGAFFGPRNAVELGAVRGSVELILGRSQDAVATLDATLVGMDPRLVAWRAAVLADQGAALARVGELDAAVDRLERALQLARKASAGDHVNRIHGVRRRDLAGRGSEPVVLRLDELLASAG